MLNPTFSLVFTKKFTAGDLIGLTYTEFMPFVSPESRTDWLKRAKANHSLNWEFEGDILCYKDFARSEALEDYSLWAI